MKRPAPVLGECDYAIDLDPTPITPTRPSSFRCLFGLHELVAFDFVWRGTPISRKTYCFRCGSLRDIHVFKSDSLTK